MYLGVCYSKLSTHTLNLDSSHPWGYLTKFAADKGAGSWEVKARLLSPVNATIPDFYLSVNAHIDSKWIDMNYELDCNELNPKLLNHRTLRLPLDGEWSEIKTGRISQYVSPRVWFFTASGCGYNFNTHKLRVRVEIRMIQPDESEFSLESRNMLYFYPMVFVVFSLVFFSVIKKTVMDYLKNEDLELRNVMLAAAIGLELYSIFFESIHLIIYAYNGSGFVIFSFFSQMCNIGSQLLIIVLCILMSSGWGISTSDFPVSDTSLFGALILVLVYVVLIGTGKVADESSYKFSMYEGTTGNGMLMLRLSLWTIFIYKLTHYYSTAGLHIQQFLINLGIMGSVYFWSLPIICLLSLAVEPWDRHSMISISSECIQLLSYLGMTYLLSKKSSYYKLSSLSGSVLPGKIN